MRSYLLALRNTDFRRLWTGSLFSLLGDGACWVALAWIGVGLGGAVALAVLGVCYTAPIIVGGLLAGRFVDRFSRRWLLVVDCVVRGATMLSVPLVALVHPVGLGQIYVVAAIFGLFKILPIGIVPAVMPELVPPEQLPTAIALEAVATGAAGLAGPALGGVLIALTSAPWVLALDAATYFAFAAAVLSMTARLDRPAPQASEGDTRRGSWRPVVAFILADRVMLVITIAFSLFNIALGALTVIQPWLVHDRFAGGSQLLGVLVGVLAGAEMVGSLIAGAMRPALRPMLRIGLLQVVAGAGLLFFLGARPVYVLIGEVVCGLPAMLLTVLSQTVRYHRTPEHLRARTLTLMRTLMLGAFPVGAALSGPFLASGNYTALVLLLAFVAGAPGLLSVIFVRNAVVNHPAPVPDAPKTSPIVEEAR